MSLPPNIADRTLATARGEAAYRIVDALEDAGYDTWWVGGTVRDMAEGNVPHDIDIATAAHPDKAKEILKQAFPTAKYDIAGEQFGTVILRIPTGSFEITTFREDDEASDGRHPEAVVYGTREQDAKRRDFTVNAMYWHPISRMLYDPFEGENDLKEKLIRFVGDPAIRIKHDALRLLRAVRFRALIGGQYHPETYRALQEHAPMIDALSGTRRLQETEKMLLGPNPARAFEDLWEIGLLSYMLPELHACKGIPQPADYHHEGDVWDHMMKIISSFTEEDGIDVRIAALFHDCGKAETFSLKERIRFDEHASVSGKLAAEALQRLQCGAKRKEKIVWLIKHHMMMGSFLELSNERKGHWYYHPWFSELLQLFRLDIAGTDPADYGLYNKIVQDYHRFLDAHPLPPKQLLSGEEVMDILSLKPGERVGEVLKALHDAQVRKEVTTKREAREFVEKTGK